MIDMKFWLETGVSIATAIGGLFLGWYAVRKIVHKVRGEWCKIQQKKDIDVNRTIQDQLHELRYESDAGRTKLFQYHNGSSFASGNSMKKMSMTHESCHPGMVPTFKGNHDQVLSLFVDMLELLSEDKSTLIVVNEMKDSYFKSYLQSNHVLMFSILPIRNTKGGQIGCILCEWCGWSFIDKIYEEGFFASFKEARNKIQYLLITEKKGR